MKLLKWIGVAFAILIVIGIFNSDDSKKASPPTSSTTQEKDQPPASPKSKPTTEPAPKPKIDVTNMALTKDNISRALETVIPKEKFKGVDITKEKGRTIIDIYFNPGDFWDEKALVRTAASKAAESMEVLFKNPKVDKIWFWTQTEMTDAKGNSSTDNVVNVSLTKENAQGINWTKFKDMVLLDYNALFSIADSYYIHPGVLKNLN